MDDFSLSVVTEVLAQNNFQSFLFQPELLSPLELCHSMIRVFSIMVSNGYISEICSLFLQLDYKAKMRLVADGKWIEPYLSFAMLHNDMIAIWNSRIWFS